MDLRGMWTVVLAGAVMMGMAAGCATAKPLAYTGTNLSGGEFYEPKPDVAPIYDKNFTYPRKDEVDYFVGKGMNIFRLGFLWETVQRSAKQPLDATELKRLKDTVNMITDHKVVCLLDPHNYARYYGKVVGGPEVGNDVFADFWGRLAQEFKGNKLVWFGLVNEPHDMPTKQWLEAANAAIAAIRKTGAKNVITVPGNAYTGAHSWNASWYGESNGTWMKQVVDPANNYILEVHQYLDSDSSGTKPVVVSPTIGADRLRDFTVWCRMNHKRALLGEFAVPATDLGKEALANMLAYMEKNADV